MWNGPILGSIITAKSELFSKTSFCGVSHWEGQPLTLGRMRGSAPRRLSQPRGGIDNLPPCSFKKWRNMLPLALAQGIPRTRAFVWSTKWGKHARNLALCLVFDCVRNHLEPAREESERVRGGVATHLGHRLCSTLSRCRRNTH